jgi:hypothetical protein
VEGDQFWSNNGEKSVEILVNQFSQEKGDILVNSFKGI